MKTQALTNGLQYNGSHHTDKPKNEKKPKNRSISWSQLLLPSYKTRLVEFRKLFAKSVPINERLIADFSCALQKEILIQGRLYLSINYISFHANIFGWETVVSIKFTDIQAITKANTIRVIPNAIQIITTTGAKYIFTSFVARDKAFKRIYRLWQDVMIGQKMSVSEVWQLIHYNYGNYLGVPSDSEEDDEELSVITRNNMNIVEEELDDEVFDDTSHTHRLRHKKRESISSFLTCPESDLEEQLNHLDAFGGDIYDNNNNNSNNNSHFIPKLIKMFMNFTTRESLYLRIILVLSIFVLLMHFLVLYKLSKVNDSYYFSQNENILNVNIDDLKQLAELTTRLVRNTEYSKI